MCSFLGRTFSLSWPGVRQSKYTATDVCVGGVCVEGGGGGYKFEYVDYKENPSLLVKFGLNETSQPGKTGKCGTLFSKTP